MADEPRFALDVDQLEAILDFLPVGAIVLDDAGTVRRFNRYEEQLSGRTRDKTIGRSFFGDVAPCTRDIELGRRFREGIEEGNLDLDIEFSFPFPYSRVARDVRIRAVSVHPSDRADRADRAVHILLIEDITSRRQLERSNAEMIQNLRSIVSGQSRSRPRTNGRARTPSGKATAPPGVSVDAIVLWAHLEAIHEAASTLAPAELFPVIDARLRKAAEIVERCGGRIERIVGDGLLATFTPVEEGARTIYDALRAAQTIAEDGRDQRLTLPFGVGLAHGPVLVGPIGRVELPQRVAIGRPIDEARALARAADAHELLMTEAVESAAGTTISADRVSVSTPRWLIDPGPALRLAHLDLPKAG